MVVRRGENGEATPALKVRQQGEVVKFEDIKEFLPSISSNSASGTLPTLQEFLSFVQSESRSYHDIYVYLTGNDPA